MWYVQTGDVILQQTIGTWKRASLFSLPSEFIENSFLFYDGIAKGITSKASLWGDFFWGLSQELGVGGMVEIIGALNMSCSFFSLYKISTSRISMIIGLNWNKTTLTLVTEIDWIIYLYVYNMFRMLLSRKVSRQVTVLYV